MPRIGSFGPYIRIKYKLELNHVIRVAVNKHVFGETKFTYLRVTSTSSQYIVAVNSKLGGTKDKESSYLWKQLLFIQIHLGLENYTLYKKWPRTGPHTVLANKRNRWPWMNSKFFILHSLTRRAKISMWISMWFISTKNAFLQYRMSQPYNQQLNSSRGVLLGILGGGEPPGFPNPDPISDQKMSFFHTRFQIWPLRIRTATKKDFLKSISNSHICLSFFSHLESKK